MIVGVPREIKPHEYRVALTPSGASALVSDGHEVLVEEAAGKGSGFSDNEYIEAGAETLAKEALFSRAGLIVKVKEPVPGEFGFFESRHVLFTYLHLAADEALTRMLLDRASLRWATRPSKKTTRSPFWSR